eukprot:Hpha_TRINITY_DN19254_c0_g1::TRINITY_DN19254_c0_g1_i1::g.194200::m.194200
MPRNSTRTARAPLPGAALLILLVEAPLFVAAALPAPARDWTVSVVYTTNVCSSTVAHSVAIRSPDLCGPEDGTQQSQQAWKGSCGSSDRIAFQSWKDQSTCTGSTWTNESSTPTVCAAVDVAQERRPHVQRYCYGSPHVPPMYDPTTPEGRSRFPLLFSLHTDARCTEGSFYGYWSPTVKDAVTSWGPVVPPEAICMPTDSGTTSQRWETTSTGGALFSGYANAACSGAFTSIVFGRRGECTPGVISNAFVQLIDNFPEGGPGWLETKPRYPFQWLGDTKVEDAYFIAVICSALMTVFTTAVGGVSAVLGPGRIDVILKTPYECPVQEGADPNYRWLLDPLNYKMLDSYATGSVVGCFIIMAGLLVLHILVICAVGVESRYSLMKALKRAAAKVYCPAFSVVVGLFFFPGMSVAGAYLAFHQDHTKRFAIGVASLVYCLGVIIAVGFVLPRDCTYQPNQQGNRVKGLTKLIEPEGYWRGDGEHLQRFGLFFGVVNFRRVVYAGLPGAELVLQLILSLLGSLRGSKDLCTVASGVQFGLLVLHSGLMFWFTPMLYTVESFGLGIVSALTAVCALFSMIGMQHADRPDDWAFTVAACFALAAQFFIALRAVASAVMVFGWIADWRARRQGGLRPADSALLLKAANAPTAEQVPYPKAVVTATNGAYLFATARGDSAKVGEVPEGTTVELVEKRGAHALVRTTDGRKSGWLPQSALTREGGDGPASSSQWTPQPLAPPTLQTLPPDRGSPNTGPLRPGPPSPVADRLKSQRRLSSTVGPNRTGSSSRIQRQNSSSVPRRPSFTTFNMPQETQPPRPEEPAGPPPLSDNLSRSLSFQGPRPDDPHPALPRRSSLSRMAHPPAVAPPRRRSISGAIGGASGQPPPGLPHLPPGAQHAVGLSAAANQFQRQGSFGGSGHIQMVEEPPARHASRSPYQQDLMGPLEFSQSMDRPPMARSMSNERRGGSMDRPPLARHGSGIVMEAPPGFGSRRDSFTATTGRGGRAGPPRRSGSGLHEREI